jgi:hypothetical protein
VDDWTGVLLDLIRKIDLPDVDFVLEVGGVGSEGSESMRV